MACLLIFFIAIAITKCVAQKSGEHTSRTMAPLYSGRASGLAAADGQPRARGVHRRNRGTENSHPARTRHACGHWANPQPRCTLKLTAMRRDPRQRRRHVQRDPCRSLHRAPAPRPASSRWLRDLRREHMLPTEPSAARGVASSSHLYKSYSPPTHSSKE